MNTSAEQRSGGAARKVVGTLGVLVLAVVAAGGYVKHRYPTDPPEHFDSPAEHFKYGSIGTDVEVGLPLLVMKVLPQAFPEYLPRTADSTGASKGIQPAQDYTVFGFVQEPGRPMPIGFSVRRDVVPRTGMNCAVCHTGNWKTRPDDTPPPLLGMGASNLDIGAFFTFLFTAARDSRFSGDYLLPFMEKEDPSLNAVDRAMYSRLIIPGMKKALVKRGTMFAQFFSGVRPYFGHGRVDAFNPLKLSYLVAHYPGGIPDSEAIGTADFPALWNQKLRSGFGLNWDGNSPRARDRNVGAAFGAGASPETIDLAAVDRVNEYLQTLDAPAYPFSITHDSMQLARGSRVFQQTCASCHAVGGAKLGKVEPWESVKTDPSRLHSYTPKFNQELLDMGAGHDWKITSMVKTNGYVNAPLDGIWARAPYLHNGSVPTLWDLLTPDDKRNGGKTTFWRGSGLYDTVNVGIRTDVSQMSNGRRATLFDVTLAGNSNKGHSGAYYGTALPVADKRALIEYLKTLR
ncbi:MAG TPA: c-type cytochrome [Gemmatimonadaceae bacterium]|nr:c-type cytochrome [Gemmatimonadaceae bacterium]